MELKGSKTEANLWIAFAGESKARNKYTYFASKAKKEGYEQIAAIFEETAGNEKEHAKLWFKELGGIGDTAANLKSAAEGEHEEWTEMYAFLVGFKPLAYCYSVGGVLWLRCRFCVCRCGRQPVLFYPLCRIHNQLKRPFRLYCRRTSILREVSSDSSVSVRFLRRA